MKAVADDVELLRLTGAGDRRAFAVFMDRHVDSVHRFLRSLGASPEDAEDALQDAFVAAWRSAGSFRGAASARSWLFTIARNALRRQHRRRVGEPAATESLEELGARAGWGSGFTFERVLEARDEVEWALRQLPVDEREAVALRDLEGFSGAEAADALGVSVASMKSRLHRGRLRLMSVLRDEGGEDA